MSVIYRLARPEDLIATDALVVASINNLTTRHGFGPMAAISPPSFQLFSLQDDPDGLWIAEDDGDVVGFAWSWVCGDLWFLAQLFVDPARQGDGIGNALLERTREQGRKLNVAHWALITFAFNRVSQGLYIRHGLLPKTPIYFLSATRERIMSLLREPPLRSIVIDDSAASFEKIAAIDAGALGVERGKHHRYLLSDPMITGVLLYAGTDCIGYSYVASNGHIGPVAVTRADLLRDAFLTSLAIAAHRPVENISAFVPATCDGVLSTAIEYGMHITFPMLLMASRDYQGWVQYLPRNPGFM